jgi:hypothetical protein
MTMMPVVPPDAMLPAPFDVSTSSDPDFPPRPAGDGEHGPGVAGLPTRQSLGFAAAPVPVDYAPPQAPDFTVPSRAAGLVLSADTVSSGSSGSSATAGQDALAGAGGPGRARRPGAGSTAAGRPKNPSYIWDLAATDVFPAAADPGPPTEAQGAVGEDGDPGAS